MTDRINYYEILHVTPYAPPDVIKAAYRALTKTMHPDAGGSAELSVAINEAYDTLQDPAKRMRYDLELKLGKEKGVFTNTFSKKIENEIFVNFVFCLNCTSKNKVKDWDSIHFANCGTCKQPLIGPKSDKETTSNPKEDDPLNHPPSQENPHNQADNNKNEVNKVGLFFAILFIAIPTICGIHYLGILNFINLAPRH